MHPLPRRLALDVQGAAPAHARRGRKADADYLLKIADNIPGGRTICAFGEACAWPVQSFVAKFKEEFIAKGAADEERRARQSAGPKAEMKLAASPHS